MAITEEQYGKLTEQLDSGVFFRLGDLAGIASMPHLLHELDDVHNLAKKALDEDFDDRTYPSLEQFFEAVEDIQHRVMEALEALEKIEKVLSNTEQVLAEALYADDFEAD